MRGLVWWVANHEQYEMANGDRLLCPPPDRLFLWAFVVVDRVVCPHLPFRSTETRANDHPHLLHSPYSPVSRQLASLRKLVIPLATLVVLAPKSFS